MTTIETERLCLREWRDDDMEPFYQMNQDTKVLEFLIGPLSMEAVRKFIVDKNQTLVEKKYTLWAVEEKSTGNMIGFIGLQECLPPLPFAPALEIAWRLGFQYWGRGYATEGATAVLDYGFKTLKISEIVSYTAASNYRSQRVMEKIGMKRDLAGDFLHPKLPSDHRLAQHVLYRVKSLSLSERSLKMIDKSAAHLMNGKASPPIGLSSFIYR